MSENGTRIRGTVPRSLYIPPAVRASGCGDEQSDSGLLLHAVSIVLQHYSVEMFSRALATIEFIMVRCRLLSIAELSLSCSDLAQRIFEVCT